MPSAPIRRPPRALRDELSGTVSLKLVRIFPLQQAQFTGQLKQMEALAEQCMADYDEDG